jgi:SAM-dependent methyltransferase
MKPLYKSDNLCIDDTQCPDFLRWLLRFDDWIKILDIGCGDKWYYSFFKKAQFTSIDSWHKSNPDFLMDLNKENLFFGDNSFDYVFMLDVIEHIEKERGKALIQQAKEIAKKGIILLTPIIWDNNEKNTFDENNFYYLNKHNLHISLWNKEDFVNWKEVSLKCFGNKYFLGIFKCQ